MLQKMTKTNSKIPKIIAIIGGMGPFASARLYFLLLEKARTNFGAKRDEEFPRIIINSLSIPNFISDTSQANSAKNTLSQQVKAMERLGCNIMGIACNTAHIFFPDLKKQFKGEFPSLIETVSDRAKNLGLKKILVLSTETTRNTKLYLSALSNRGIGAVQPDNRFQKLITRVIQKTISNTPLTHVEKTQLSKQAKALYISSKSDGVILGCTELPLVFPKKLLPNTIDSLDCLADKLLSIYYKESCLQTPFFCFAPYL